MWEDNMGWMFSLEEEASLWIEDFWPEITVNVKNIIMMYV